MVSNQLAVVKMASPPKSTFPKFLDGDVLIIVTPTQYYKLHSQVLSSHSSWFAEQIGAKPGPRLNAQARRENAAAYRFEFQPASVAGEVGSFERVVWTLSWQREPFGPLLTLE